MSYRDEILVNDTMRNDNRNIGIDLLRIVAMFFVVVLHCLGQGGILKNTLVNSVQYRFSWFVEIFAYSAVNIFALISGYVSYTDKEKEINYSKYINIWLQVVFHGLFITIFFDMINTDIVSLKDYIIVLFPFTNNLYWYFTAYTGVFFIMPILNNSIRKLDVRELKSLFVIIILLFSIQDIFTKNFSLNRGYSFIWIALLYILGAIIKKCNIGKNLKNYQCIGAIIGLCFITYLYKIYGMEISICNIKITKDLFISYTSPTILGIAILYLIWFSKMKVNEYIKIVIKSIAPSAFAIYILNNHRYIWSFLMKDLFICISEQSILIIFFSIIIFTILFIIISIVLDKIRLLIFEKLHIQRFIENVSRIIDKILMKIVNII